MRLLALLFLVSPAYACDWQVRQDVDPMTDANVCTITSESARMFLRVEPESTRLFSIGGYVHANDALTVRLDDDRAIYLPQDARSTGSYKDHARRVVDRLSTAQRIRVSAIGPSGAISGDAQVCNLPALIASCR